MRDIDQFIDLYYNFITDPDMKIIDRNLKEQDRNLREELGEEHYNIEILNNYLF